MSASVTLARVLDVTADVNWLLSSLAQSTAALIAIVGGLLVSRYVSLHAEQSAAGRRVDDLDRRVAAATQRLQDARADIDRHEVADLLERDAIYELVYEP